MSNKIKKENKLYFSNEKKKLKSEINKNILK